MQARETINAPHANGRQHGSRKSRVVRRLTLALLGSLVLAAALLAFEIHVLTTPTWPERQLLARGARQALVILDVQEDYTGVAAQAPYPYAASAALIERLNRTSRMAAAAGMDVVYVRQIYTRPLSKLISHAFLSGTALAGSRGASFDQRLHVISAHTFDKPLADAFSSRAFEAFVDSHQIGETVLAGLDGAGCVDRTARGALRRGIRVTVLEDAVLTRDPDDWRELRRDYPALGIRMLSSAQLSPR